jgi:molybdopterin/thiamine biosynthesis adenylyltransferase
MTERRDFREIKPAACAPAGQPAPRHARLPQFVGGSADAATVFGALKVGLVGAGSVGGRVAAHLARLGVAALWIVDPKRFKPESLLTHEVGPRAVGRPKAVATARRCQALSPRTRVFAFAGPVQDLPLDAFAEADLVVMAPDNLPCEVETGQRCRRLGKPLLHAALHGETLTTQVRFFGTDAEAACPACLFSAEEWRLSQQARFSCEGLLPGQPEPAATEPPTVSVSSLCALAADLALNQILRHMLRLGAPVENTLLEYCGFTNRTVTARLKRNAQCPCEHSRFILASPPRALRDCTPAELAQAAGLRNDDAALSFGVDGREWVEAGACRCPQPAPVWRFIARAAARIGACAKCGAPLQPMPFFTQRFVPAASLGPALGRPLRSRCRGAIRCVVVRAADKAVLFRDPETGDSTP